MSNNQQNMMLNRLKAALVAYQGAKYFSYNGKVLDEIRKEHEKGI